MGAVVDTVGFRNSVEYSQRSDASKSYKKVTSASVGPSAQVVPVAVSTKSEPQPHWVQVANKVSRQDVLALENTLRVDYIDSKLDMIGKYIQLFERCLLLSQSSLGDVEGLLLVDRQLSNDIKLFKENIVSATDSQKKEYNDLLVSYNKLHGDMNKLFDKQTPEMKKLIAYIKEIDKNITEAIDECSYTQDWVKNNIKSLDDLGKVRKRMDKVMDLSNRLQIIMEKINLLTDKSRELSDTFSSTQMTIVAYVLKLKEELLNGYCELSSVVLDLTKPYQEKMHNDPAGALKELQKCVISNQKNMSYRYTGNLGTAITLLYDMKIQFEENLFLVKPTVKKSEIIKFIEDVQKLEQGQIPTSNK